MPKGGHHLLTLFKAHWAGQLNTISCPDSLGHHHSCRQFSLCVGVLCAGGIWRSLTYTYKLGSRQPWGSFLSSAL